LKIGKIALSAKARQEAVITNIEKNFAAITKAKETTAGVVAENAITKIVEVAADSNAEKVEIAVA
jgi:hypothetical protein